MRLWQISTRSLVLFPLLITPGIWAVAASKHPNMELSLVSAVIYAALFTAASRLDRRSASEAEPVEADLKAGARFGFIFFALLATPQEYYAITDRLRAGGPWPEAFGYAECVMLGVLALVHAALGALGGVLTGFAFDHARRNRRGGQSESRTGDEKV